MSATSIWGGRRRSRCSQASTMAWRTSGRRILPSGSTTPPRKSGDDLERDEIGFAPPLNQSPFVPAEATSACTHLESDTTGLSAPLPPRALASGGEGSGVGGVCAQLHHPPRRLRSEERRVGKQ